MANANTPHGLLPSRHTDGTVYNGAVRAYYVPASVASNIFIGDPVLVLGGGDANGIPAVGLATAGASNYITGAMVGIVNQGGIPSIGGMSTVTRDLPIYRQGGIANYILVADDPSILFNVQEDSVTSTITAAVGPSINANLQAGAGGSVVTGYSSWQLVSNTVATTNTFQMRIIQALQEVDNIVGQANCKWLCRINLQSQSNTTGV